jgi:ribonuclease BN (tRNA processing enzyme)
MCKRSCGSASSTNEHNFHSANGGRSQVKKLVLSHFVPGDDPSITDAIWIEGVRKNFSGEIVVGHDLMTV